MRCIDGTSGRGAAVERWEDVEGFLLEMAEEDITATGELTPCLVAFAGEVPLFLAFLRPFARGAHADPLIELLALAMPLGANRLAVSVAGRAWSLDDPLPPVVEGVGDLRQQVVCIHTADGAVAEPRLDGLVRPYTLHDGAPQWEGELRPGPAQGWIPETLLAAVTSAGELEVAPEDLVAQAQRCVTLGHQLYLAPAGDAMLPAS